MTQQEYLKDIVILVADGNMRAAVASLLARPESLQIRPPRLDDIPVHPQHDSGCFNDAHHFLRPFSRRCHYAMVLMDMDGSGAEAMGAEKIQCSVEQALSDNGWPDRNRCIVIRPELENWFWSDSPHVAAVTGWPDLTSLRLWLRDQEFWAVDVAKPRRPKEALEAAVRYTRTPRSASLYSELARQVSLDRCTDTSFTRFKDTLRAWFGVNS